MTLTVEVALQRILTGVRTTGTEVVAIEGAAGRILAAPLVARLTKPPLDVSAMDGYAVRGTDVSRFPAQLTVIGRAAAGHPFGGHVGPGEAVRIFTGAPLPAGADTIVIQENTKATGTTVEVRSGAIDPEHVRTRGMDFCEGAVLLAEGQHLGPREITLAAAMGYGEVPVRRRPRIAVLATGDELVPPGVMPDSGQVVSSNALGIAALLTQTGAATQLLGIARDRADELAAAIRGAEGSDVLVTIGGASVGDHDLVGPVLRDLGMTLEFWKLNLRPGKPLLFGHLGSQRVLGLPGNPVSAMICAHLFLIPLVRALLGCPPQPTGRTVRAQLTEPVEANGPRRHYMRASLVEKEGGQREVTVARNQDSSLLVPLVAANALLVRGPDAPALPAGAEVEVLRLDF